MSLRRYRVDFYIIVLFVFTLSFKLQAEDLACLNRGPESALVIIDMQKFFVQRNGYYTVPENKEKLNNLITSQLSSIKMAIENKIPIIFIEYSCSVCGATDEVLKKAVEGYPKVRFIKKTTDGAFDGNNSHKKDLIDYMNSYQVGTLIIAGANGGACVRHTILGALQNNCNVIAFNDGIADLNFQSFIYPYTEKYSNIKPECKNCNFKEVQSIEKLQEHMKKTADPKPSKKTNTQSGTNQ